MSTWHQDRNPVQLWHAELWTLVSNPPGQLMTVARFRDPIEAQRRADREPGSYVLPPQKLEIPARP